MKRAARLFGAMEAAHDLIRFVMAPIERAQREQDLAATRAELGEDAFTTAREEGRNMTLDEAVALALEQTVELK